MARPGQGAACGAAKVTRPYAIDGRQCRERIVVPASDARAGTVAIGGFAVLTASDKRWSASRATRRRALFDPPRSGCPAQGAKPGDLGKRFVAALGINQKVVNRSAPELFPAACLHKKMVHLARN